MNNATKFISTLTLFMVVTLLTNSCKIAQKKVQRDKPYLIMLSLDGFRWDYPVHANTPVLDSLKSAGVFAEMKPCFPTKTFPNHYSIATGLYPDHHGIVLNRFYAPDLQRSYSISDRKSVGDGAFYGGEPVWVMAVKQGIKNATLFWVGSEAAIQGIRPERWYKYDQGLPFASRIDSIKTWLSLPESQRPHLILWYYHEPDASGHRYGPQGKQTLAMVEQLDKWLGKFFTIMRKLPEFKQLNFIITSDHGMASISKKKSVFLTQIIDTSDIAIINGGNPVYNLKVKKGKLEKIFKKLKANPHLKVWKHDSLPKRLHYGTNIRTLDITLVADTGWSAYLSPQKHYGNGAHGYENNWKAMHAIFYAAGPAFKKNYHQPIFINVDIYPLIARILKMKPAKNDGKLDEVKGMLAK